MADAPRHAAPSPEEAVRRAAARARAEGQPTWVVWRRPLPRRTSTTPGDAGDPAPRLAGAEDALRWREPSRGLALDATGAAAVLEAGGAGRIEALARRAAGLAARVFVCDELPGAGPRPTWIVGLGFEDEPTPDGPEEPWRDFPPARLLLPARLRVRMGDEPGGEPAASEAIPAPSRRERWERWEHRAIRIEPGQTEEAALARLRAEAPARRSRDERPLVSVRPDWQDEAYRARVGRAVADVRSGELEKVVVAREVRCTAAAELDPDALFERLADRFPGCRVFGVARGEAAFVGATPERLVRVTEGEVRADALAGSARRGRDLGEDARLGRALRESKKEQAEHAVVVRALREALAPVCTELAVDESPALHRLANVQHLHSRALGWLRPGLAFPLLDLAARLHPTPAVAGSPREAARDWLRRHEGLARGWYAGALGWCDLRGDGELAVALRSAWLRGREARLYAGAGVVEGSDPESELRETRMKLEAVLAALGDDLPGRRDGGNRAARRPPGAREA